MLTGMGSSDFILQIWSLCKSAQTALHPGGHQLAVSAVPEVDVGVGVEDQLAVESCRVPVDPVSDGPASGHLCFQRVCAPPWVEDTQPEGGNLDASEVLLALSCRQQLEDHCSKQ